MSASLCGQTVESGFKDIRQQACEKAVQFACSIGDPFAEALGCDVAAWPGTQWVFKWIGLNGV